ATPSGGANASVSTLVDGDGTALVLGQIGSTRNVQNEQLILNSPGNARFGLTPLTTFAGTIATWGGPVTLERSNTIQIEPSGRLAIDGIVDDAPNPGATGSDLTLTGGGELDLGGANTYRGTTFVNQGVLALKNGQALGGTGVSEVQQVTLSGSTNGTFTLTFHGQTTAPLAATATAAQVQTALNALSTIGGVGGTVSVTLSGNDYTITFQGSLVGFDQPPLTGAGSGGTIVAVATTVN